MLKRIICLCAVCALVLSLVACNEMPADTQAPVTEAPITKPPITEPPVTEPPATEPPVTEPPATEPPVTEPPVTEPPATEPPVTEPPVTEPPVTEPPATEPPVTEPPVTEPPVTDPPATEPPATEPPVTEPPATEPPATEPPVIDQPEPEPTAGLEYRLNAAGDGYIVTGFDKVQEGHLILGGVYNGLPVTEIGAPDAEFRSISDANTYVTEITVLDGVKVLNYCAFCHFTALTEVSLPDTLETVGENVFRGCKSLKRIRIPDSVTSMGEGVFYSCEALESVELSNAVEVLPKGAFMKCKSLTSIVIPEGVTRISMSVFAGCSALTAITYPSTLVKIDPTAFTIGRITDIYINSLEMWLALADSGTVMSASSITLYLNGEVLKHVDIPDSVTSIRSGAFLNMTSIKSVKIPSSVTEIKGGVFSGCSSLESAEFECKDGWVIITKVKDYPLTDMSDKGEMAKMLLGTIPEHASGGIQDDIVRIERRVPEEPPVTEPPVTEPPETEPPADAHIHSWSEWSAEGNALCTVSHTESRSCSCGEREEREVEAGHKYENDACKVCGELKPFESLVYALNPSGDSYTVTGHSAPLPTHLIVGGIYNGLPVTVIGDNAFRLSDIESLTVLEGVTRIGYAAFERCMFLTSIELPSTLTVIDGSVFRTCRLLESIGLPESITEIGACAFMECYALSELALPDGLTSIGYSAFSKCTSLTSVVIPEGIEQLEQYTFSGCSRLASITFPSAFKFFGLHAFGGTVISEVHISDLDMWFGLRGEGSLVTAKELTLYLNGEIVEELDIPEGMTEISGHITRFNKHLKTVRIPESATMLAQYPFLGCTALESVEFGVNGVWVGHYSVSPTVEIEDVTAYPNLIEFLTDSKLVAFGRKE